MCITFIHLSKSPNSKFKLIVAMNRDEYYARPTKSASWKGQLFGGWDDQKGREGGTWLSCRGNGKIGMLTNIFTGGRIDTKAKGRGFLVVDYLNSDVAAGDYLDEINKNESTYNPFNLILLEPSDRGEYDLWMYSRGRQGHTNSCLPKKFCAGTFGISNHPVDKNFIKSEKGKKILHKISESNVTSKEEIFFELEKMLKDCDSNWPDEQILEQSICKDEEGGSILEYLECLSSICVKTPVYGTRTHSMIIVDNENFLHFKEITLENGEWKTTEESIELKS